MAIIDPPGPTDADQTAVGPTCACGHDRSHYMVSPEGQYTALGWLQVTLIGISVRPHRIDYRCRVCQQQFDSTSDPELLRRHI